MNPLRSVFTRVFAVSCLFPLLLACSESEEDHARKLIKAQVSGATEASEWPAAPIYGGVGLIAPSGACYWVKDELAFACNPGDGPSADDNPDLLQAPSSILTDDVRDAIGGKAFPLPPALNSDVWQFAAGLTNFYVSAQADADTTLIPLKRLPADEKSPKAVYPPAVAAYNNVKGWKILHRDQEVATLLLHEKGGEITKIEAFARVRTKPGAIPGDLPENAPAGTLLYYPVMRWCPTFIIKDFAPALFPQNRLEREFHESSGTCDDVYFYTDLISRSKEDYTIQLEVKPLRQPAKK